MKKISLFFAFLMMSVLSFTAAADNLRGDCNQDGSVSIDDVTAMIDYLLTNNPNGVDMTATDCNLDGSVSIDDVTVLIDYLLVGSWPDEPVTPPEGHTYVDLDLPSGTLWATCNVGANSPEEYGSYFAWGEITTKDEYSVYNYLWCNGSMFELTKYNTNSSDGSVVDWKTELDLEDDAAHRIWGSPWCIPSPSDVNELKNNCTQEWTTLNGVTGCKLTGPNGNTLFIPAAGCIEVTTSRYKGVNIMCWTNKLDNYSPASAYRFNGSYSQYYTDYLSASYSYLRWAGLTIRPVIHNN